MNKSYIVLEILEGEPHVTFVSSDKDAARKRFVEVAVENDYPEALHDHENVVAYDWKDDEYRLYFLEYPA